MKHFPIFSYIVKCSVHDLKLSLEGKEVLKLAIKKADAEHCTLVLANDPDVDRLAVAELDPRGRWKLFNGNELGALLGWWALENYKTRTPKPAVTNCIMIATLVSSRILAAMARVEGFIFVEGMPSFPWMAHRALELEKSGRTVLFAFEECFGYMFGMSLPDKDGIGAAMQLASMACYLRSTRNVTLIEKLRRSTIRMATTRRSRRFIWPIVQRQSLASSVICATLRTKRDIPSSFWMKNSKWFISGI